MIQLRPDELFLRSMGASHDLALLDLAGVSRVPWALGHRREALLAGLSLRQVFNLAAEVVEVDINFDLLPPSFLTRSANLAGTLLYPDVHQVVSSGLGRGMRCHIQLSL